MSDSPVAANEIRWTLDPVPTVDPLLQSDDDVVFTALSEADVYRLLALEAVHSLHERDGELCRLRGQHYRLIDQFRAVRAGAAA